tara:strand:- start:1193 stop:3739 length:2547 start_codon:yes stop_codon:yes gene_type:complete
MAPTPVPISSVVEKQELFEEPDENTYVNTLRLNTPFMVANGVAHDALEDISALNLEEVYDYMLNGGGYAAMPTRRDDSRANIGFIGKFSKEAVATLYSYITNLPFPKDKPFEQRLSWSNYPFDQSPTDCIDAMLGAKKGDETLAKGIAVFGPEGNPGTWKSVFGDRYVAIQMRDMLDALQTAGYEGYRFRHSFNWQQQCPLAFSPGDLGDATRNHDASALDDTELIEHGDKMWINGQAMLKEMILAICASRLGAYAPIACCGSAIHDGTPKLFMLQCDPGVSLNTVLREDWLKWFVYDELPRKANNNESADEGEGVKLLDETGTLCTTASLEAAFLRAAIRSVRLLSRVPMIVLNMSPCAHFSCTAWVDPRRGSRENANVFTDAVFSRFPAESCHLVDLNEEFCEWYMLSYFYVGLAGSLRATVDRKAQLYLSSCEMLNHLFVDRLVAQNVHDFGTVDNRMHKLIWILYKWWRWEFVELLPDEKDYTIAFGRGGITQKTTSVPDSNLESGDDRNATEQPKVEPVPGVSTNMNMLTQIMPPPPPLVSPPPPPPPFPATIAGFNEVIEKSNNARATDSGTNAQKTEGKERIGNDKSNEGNDGKNTSPDRAGLLAQIRSGWTLTPPKERKVSHSPSAKTTVNDSRTETLDKIMYAAMSARGRFIRADSDSENDFDDDSDSEPNDTVARKLNFSDRDNGLGDNYQTSLGVHHVKFGRGISANQRKLPVAAINTPLDNQNSRLRLEEAVERTRNVDPDFQAAIKRIGDETAMSREAVIFAYTMHKSICDLAVNYTWEIHSSTYQTRWQSIARALVSDASAYSPVGVIKNTECSLDVLKTLVLKSKEYAYKNGR